MLAVASQDILQPTAILFFVGFALLFLIYYFTSPVYTEYGDRRSRLLYSLLNSFYFSLVLAILFALLPWLSNAYGVLPSLVVGLIIILVSTFAQVYVIALLVRGGFLKMRQKKRRR
ncbi:MAG TPA: hypothetical protein VMC61_06140 [Methanocella sp.]|nr:hypothetical protein [Methanocella sp.]